MSQTFLPYYLQHGNNNNQDSCKCVGDIKAKHDPIQNDTTITSDANVKPATATTTSDMLLSWNPEAKLIVNRINNMSVVLGVLNSIIGVVLCTFGAQVQYNFIFVDFLNFLYMIIYVWQLVFHQIFRSCLENASSCSIACFMRIPSLLNACF